MFSQHSESDARRLVCFAGTLPQRRRGSQSGAPAWQLPQGVWPAHCARKKGSDGQFASSPVAHHCLDAVLQLRVGAHERVVRFGCKARKSAKQEKMGDPLGIGCRKHDADGRALGTAEYHGTLGTDLVHDCAQVVDPLLQRRNASCAVGEALSALVEGDDTREGA